MFSCICFHINNYFMLMFPYAYSSTICYLCLQKYIQLVLLRLQSLQRTLQVKAINPLTSQECQPPARFILIFDQVLSILSFPPPIFSAPFPAFQICALISVFLLFSLELIKYVIEILPFGLLSLLPIYEIYINPDILTCHEQRS